MTEKHCDFEFVGSGCTRRQAGARVDGGIPRSAGEAKLVPHGDVLRVEVPARLLDEARC